ncbi:DUF3558 domain-containing protein [Nocardia suismassiliense]|uniref:hypothetical protein n=1 Tax=Nocardia suismassiliense TaxID=2077092 RepID=UPI000D1D7A68|nr:hypothetical protein [Nocardia suismassiliense]
MIGTLRVAVGAALLCASMVGCTSDEGPVDTSSTKYLFEEVFNPCREVPSKFLLEHHLGAEPESADNLIDGYIYWGCDYNGRDYDLTIFVSNTPLAEVGRGAPHTFQSIQIAGRAAKILSRPLEKRFCNLYIEMTGGILELGLIPRSPIEACPTVTAVAEGLVPLLPPGA